MLRHTKNYSYRKGAWGLFPQQAKPARHTANLAEIEQVPFCAITRPRLQLLYRKSYAEKVQEVEKDPKIPVSFRNAVQKIGITITGIISSEIVIIDFQ